jgi:hypothetical protein
VRTWSRGVTALAWSFEWCNVYTVLWLYRQRMKSKYNICIVL